MTYLNKEIAAMSDGNPMGDFFSAPGQQFQTLATDDVLIKPRRSVSVGKVDISTKIGNLRLKRPFLSAAMDTVTEKSMAIALAERGGLGVIHRNLEPKEQAQHVQRVKFRISGEMVENPVLLTPEMTLQEVLDMCAKKEYGFRTFPVVDTVEGRHLIGLITSININLFHMHGSAKVRDIMTINPRCVVENTTASQAFALMQEYTVTTLPVVDSEKRVIGLYLRSDLDRHLYGDHGQFHTDSCGRLLVGAAVGAGKEDMKRISMLVEKGVDAIVIDLANGYAKWEEDIIRNIATEFPNRAFTLIAGNVATAEGAEALFNAGADAVKVGIGAGSICTTRTLGSGVGQLSATYECAKIARRLGKTIISDGGIRNAGDIIKLLAVGADAIMMGNMFAGTDESPAETVIINGIECVRYRGMGSRGARSGRVGGRYADTSEIVSEGVEGVVRHRGSVRPVIDRLAEEVKTGMASYAGARNIEELRSVALQRVTHATHLESGVHSLDHITSSV
jgi:IMP dehydrogenase